MFFLLYRKCIYIYKLKFIIYAIYTNCIYRSLHQAPCCLLVFVLWVVKGLSKPIMMANELHFRQANSPLCYFEIIAPALNMGLSQNNTMGSNWIDLKCSSQNVLTSHTPLTKQTATEGLVQATYIPTAIIRRLILSSILLLHTNSSSAGPWLIFCQQQHYVTSAH